MPNEKRTDFHRWIQLVSELSRSTKRAIMVVGDVVMIPLVLYAAITLKLGPIEHQINGAGWLYLAVALTSVPMFAKLWLYRAVVRYLAVLPPCRDQRDKVQVFAQPGSFQSDGTRDQTTPIAARSRGAARAGCSAPTRYRHRSNGAKNPIAPMTKTLKQLPWRTALAFAESRFPSQSPVLRELDHAAVKAAVVVN